MRSRINTTDYALSQAKALNAQRRAVKREAIARLIRAGQGNVEIARALHTSRTAVAMVRREVEG